MNANATFKEIAITVQPADSGTYSKNKTQIVTLLFFHLYLACTFVELYIYADEDVYGLTICSPLNGQYGNFEGAMCADVSPTLSSKSTDNYLRNMYLTQEALSTNYIISDDSTIVS